MIAIGAAVEVAGPASLSASRRLRDFVLFYPGLLAWRRAASSGCALVRR